jgi:hypothetical protein
MATPLHAEGEGTKLSSTGMTPDTFAVSSGPRRIAFDGTHMWRGGVERPDPGSGSAMKLFIRDRQPHHGV